MIKPIPMLTKQNINMAQPIFRLAVVWLEPHFGQLSFAILYIL